MREIDALYHGMVNHVCYTKQTMANFLPSQIIFGYIPPKEMNGDQSVYSGFQPVCVQSFAHFCSRNKWFES